MGSLSSINIKTIDNYLSKSANGTNLALFRIAYGIILLWEVFYMIRIDFVENFITGPELNLKYPYLEFIVPASPFIMELSVYVLGVLALAITLGVYFRQAVLLFGILFAYVFFIDVSYYNNHLYLVILICILFSFTHADRNLSLMHRLKDVEIPYWHYVILKIQVGIVYFYGGIAKLNPFWLEDQEPARVILSSKAAETGLEWLENELVVYIITYAGTLYDLAIIFILFSRFKYIGLFFAVVFNASNAWIFNDINIFPYFMLCVLVIYLPKEKKLTQHQKLDDFRMGKFSRYALIGFFSFQLLFPFRHYFIEGYADWTGQFQRFSWRMKIQNRQINSVEFEVLDPDKRVIYPVNLNSFKINPDQINNMALFPDCTRQFAVYLGERAKKTQGISNPMVRARIDVDFNGQENVLVVNPEVDLTKVSPVRAQPFDWVGELPN